MSLVLIKDVAALETDALRLQTRWKSSRISLTVSELPGQTCFCLACREGAVGAEGVLLVCLCGISLKAFSIFF